jgi:hypothetical protein
MDLSNVRRMSKQPYETVRGQLEELGDRVTSRHEDGAPVRHGYRRFLGALDELAGRLLDDDEISQRGQGLLREDEADGAAAPDEAGDKAEAEAEAASGDSAWATAEAEAEADAADRAEGADVTQEAAGTSGVAGAGAAGAEAGVAEAAGAAAASDTAEPAVVRGKTAPVSTGAATTEPGETGPAEVPVGESWAAANAQVAEEHAEADEAGASPVAAAAQSGRTVDVVFSLPADVKADRVALCGEFNDWSPESTALGHQDDGSWSVTVPLAPGTYRYKYLLDGATWENGSDATRYEENAYGTMDSVIEVS